MAYTYAIELVEVAIEADEKSVNVTVTFRGREDGVETVAFTEVYPFTKNTFNDGQQFKVFFLNELSNAVNFIRFGRELQRMVGQVITME